MLLLEYDNLLIKSILSERLLEPDSAPAAISQIVSDFDNVTFYISTPESKSKIQISMRMRCFRDLEKYGVSQVLQREYGQYIVATEPGYDFTIAIDVDAVQANLDYEQRQELVLKCALLKRNALAAPFERAFARFDELSREAHEQGVDLYVPNENMEEVMAIHYRDEESIFIKPAHDRVTVFFSTVFRDETDKIFGKVFLQEFVDARRRASQNAPQVLYSHREPPREIKDALGPRANADNVGYVTFVLFPRHLSAQRRETCISHIQTFRDYFHYHIKCSKAYMHSRMRYRVSEFLKVLNRAKPENVDKERKTASGRRFRVASP